MDGVIYATNAKIITSSLRYEVTLNNKFDSGIFIIYREINGISFFLQVKVVGVVPNCLLHYAPIVYTRVLVSYSPLLSFSII